MAILKKCQPGVVCFENVTLVSIGGVMILLFYFWYSSLKNNTSREKEGGRHRQEHRQEHNTYGNNNNNNNDNEIGLFVRPQHAVSNIPNDVLLNPYVPPLRDERYMVPPGRVPINISTNVGAVDTSYRQVGLLTPINPSGKNNDVAKIIPLMGRPLFSNREKWQYYSMSDQNNSVKLPIIIKNRNATNEYGVDKVYNGDIVYVEGYKQAFKVTEYENDTVRYLPYL